MVAQEPEGPGDHSRTLFLGLAEMAGVLGHELAQILVAEANDSKAGVGDGFQQCEVLTRRVERTDVSTVSAFAAGERDKDGFEGLSQSHRGDVIGETVIDLLADSSPQGNLANVADASGRKIQYRYDAVGHLIETILPDGNRSSIEYDLRGRRTTHVDFAGVRTER